VTAGVLAGYQVEFDRIVAGAEADLSLAGFSANDATYEGRLNQIDVLAAATLRARLGMTFDRAMVFGTAGIVAASFTKTDSEGVAASPQLALGWTVGGGVEYTLDDDLRIRAEYLHYSLGDVTTNLGVGEGFYSHRSTDIGINIVRMGISQAF
jgi:outer membrane immunogenic protein